MFFFILHEIYLQFNCNTVTARFDNELLRFRIEQGSEKWLPSLTDQFTWANNHGREDDNFKRKGILIL